MNVIFPVSVLECSLKFMHDYPVLPNDNVSLTIRDPELLKIGGTYRVEFSSDKRYIKIKTDY